MQEANYCTTGTPFTSGLAAAGMLTSASPESVRKSATVEESASYSRYTGCQMSDARDARNSMEATSKQLASVRGNLGKTRQNSELLVKETIKQEKKLYFLSDRFQSLRKLSDYQKFNVTSPIVEV
jgi:hypothetical protein